MKLTKKFTQRKVSHDCEARHWTWEDTNETYEEAVKELAKEWDGWFEEVREVEKTFDDETFEITIKVIRVTERTYDKVYHSWKGGIAETIYEE